MQGLQRRIIPLFIPVFIPLFIPNLTQIRHESGTNCGMNQARIREHLLSLSLILFRVLSLRARTRNDRRAKSAEDMNIIIPESLNDPECRHVAKTWFQYLKEKDLGDRNPENSATQLQEWWRQMARKGRDKFLRDVRGSISHGWKTIRDVDDAGTSRGGQVRSAQPDTDPDFLRAVAVCKEFPSGSDYDREKRESALGPLIRVVRKMTSARLAECDKFTQKQLAAEWTINREALR